MLSTDRPSRFFEPASFYSTIKHPSLLGYSNFYNSNNNYNPTTTRGRPQFDFDVADNTSTGSIPYQQRNKYGGGGAYHPFGDDGLDFFGKLNSHNYPSIDQQFQQQQESEKPNRFAFRDSFFGNRNQNLTSSNDHRFSEFAAPSSEAEHRFRHNPYSSASRDHRLSKILYKSVANIEHQTHLPNKYAGWSIRDKLDALKNIITNFDITPSRKKAPPPEEKSTPYLNSRFGQCLTTLMNSFNPTETSTPVLPNQPNKQQKESVVGGGILQAKPAAGRGRTQNSAAEQAPPRVVTLTETPSSSKTFTTTNDLTAPTAPTSSMIDLKATPMSVQQKWRMKKYTDERSNRQKEAEELEKELQLREKARYDRAASEEENRRLRLKLEGLVLERRVPPREEFPELSSVAKHLINIIWNKSLPHDEVFVKGFGADITRKDLLTLSGQEWLNDEVINFFLNLIVERNAQDTNLPKAYTFNTFFYQKLSSDGYAGVKRWTRKLDIFAHELLIVPVHLPNHWCLTIIDLKNKKMDYYDSMFGSNKQCLQLLSDYLCQESLDKRKKPYDMGGWEMECRKDIPRQTNFSDCGMFSCIFAEYASRRAPTTFEQKHIPYFRERMVHEICQKKLL